MRKFIYCLVSIGLMLTACTDRNIDDPGRLVPKTVDQDDGLSAITVNGIRLHAEAFGHPDSTLIVCIHGGPGSDYRYMLNCRELANVGYRVVFYDQRGSGLSQRLSEKYYKNQGEGAINAMYDELDGVINHYRTHPTQKVVLLGHSWGGMLATAYTGKYPNKVNGLIVGEPGGLKWSDVKDYVSRSRDFEFLGELLNDAVYLDQFITGKSNQHEILDYKMAMLAGNNDITGEVVGGGDGFWRNGAVIASSMFDLGEEVKPDFSAGIEHFSIPVLFFYSQHNKAYHDDWANRISGFYPTVERHKISGVGHNGIISDAQAWHNETLPIIIAYLSKR